MKKSEYTKIFLLFFLSVFTILAVSSDLFLKTDFGYEAIEMNSNWEVNNKKINIADISDYCNHNGNTLLTKKLPSSIPNGMKLNFRSKNTYFIIKIDGKEIYSFNESKRQYLINYVGVQYHSVTLDEKDAAKTMTIETKMVYEDHSCFIDQMELSDSQNYFKHMLKIKGVDAFLCVMIILIGIVIILFYFSMRTSHIETFDLLALGLSTIMIGLWSFEETSIPMLLWSKHIFVHVVAYTMLLFLPYPVIKFSHSILALEDDIYLRLTLFSTIVTALLSMILNIMGVIDVHQGLRFTHVNMLVGVVVEVAMIYKAIRLVVTKERKPVLSPVIVVSFTMFFLSVLFDLFNYIMSDSAVHDAGFYSRIGLFIYINILFVYIFKKNVDIARLGGQTEHIRKLAYVDVLTNLGNRTAWINAKDGLRENINEGKFNDALIVMLDINNLKHVNDTFGHEEGDRYIVAASNAIRQSFGSFGGCYRTGGDEFVAFIAGDKDLISNFEHAYRKMLFYIDEYNATGPVAKLEIAAGYALVSHTQSKTIDEALKEADSDMYNIKKMMKQVVA